jgi:hypothetical protein
MRRIESKERKRKKEKKNQLIIGVVMIALLVFSTAGFALFSGNDETTQENEKVTHNGYEFIRQNNVWITEINTKNHAFFFLPTEIKNISIDITNNVLTYTNKPLYIVNTNAATNQIAFNLYPEYILRVQNACLNTTNCTNNYPVKDCQTDNIIIFQNENDTTNVYQNENCIYIEGDVMKGSDKFLQRLLQID